MLYKVSYMVLWLVGVITLLLLGCDTEHLQNEPYVALRSLDDPQRAPPVECVPAIAAAEAGTTLTISWTPDASTWLRRFEAVVPLGDGRSALLGEYGDYFVEGLLVVAFDDDGSTAWEAELATEESFDVSHARQADEGLWVVGAQAVERTMIWRYSLAGSEEASLTLVDFYATEITRTPSDGLLLTGRNLDEESLAAELSSSGELLWQGSLEQAAFERVVVDGSVHRIAADGAEVWTHDPRPEPYPGFPIDVGARWARLLPSGSVVGAGSIVGEGGASSVVFGLRPDGASSWRQDRPFVVVGESRVLPGERLLVMGSASECWMASYGAVLDSSGSVMFEARSEGPVLGVDAQGRVLEWTDTEPGSAILTVIGEVTR